MGLRGPPRKPDHLKLISGTPIRQSEETPPVGLDEALTELPSAPSWLPNDLAREEWAKVGALLVSKGWLNSLRLSALGMYCALQGKLAQQMQAGTMPSAYSMQQLRGMQRDLGITGLTAPPQGKSDDPNKPGKWAGLKQRSEFDSQF